MAEFGGASKKIDGGVPIKWAAAAAEPEHGQGEHRLRVAAIGGERVPGDRLGVVVRNAVAVGIQLAEQRHCCRVALLRNATACLGECGRVAAPLIGRIRTVDARLRCR